MWPTPRRPTSIGCRPARSKDDAIAAGQERPAGEGAVAIAFCSAAAGCDGGKPERAAFGSEHVDRRETRLPGDAVPKVDCKADVAGPKRIPSAADGDLSAAILDDGRHGELACAVEPNRVVRATVELEECVAIAAGAVAKVRALGERSGGPGEATGIQKKCVKFSGREGRIRECRHHARRTVTVLT